MRYLAYIPALMMAAAPVADGQPPPNFSFSYRTSVNSSSAPLPANGQITVSAVVGAPITVFLVAENRGADAWNVSRVGLTGQAFSLLNAPAQLIAGGGSAVFSLRFAPSASGTVSDVISVNVANASGTVTSSFNFFISGTGLAPDLVTSYFLTAGGNQVLLQNGERIPFPDTQAGQATAVTIVIQNRGTAPGTIRAAAVTGSKFRLTGLPLLPSVLAAERELRFGVAFEPLGAETESGQLSVDLGEGKRLDIQLQGRGITAAYTYSAQIGANDAGPLMPGGTLILSDTPAGATVTATIVIRNTGSANGRIGVIASTNAAFRLANLPPLPAALAPGASVSLQVVFQARESGKTQGRLLVDQTIFELEAVSLAPRLAFAVRNGDAVTPVSDGGPILFPNVVVGGSNEITFQIANTGNAPAQIFGISVSGRIFQSGTLPPLPLTLGSEESRQFTLRFTPEAVGPVTGTIQIDDKSLGLLGVGTTPGPVPGVTFTSVADTVQSLQQPAVGLSLASPYDVDLTGRITLAFTPESFGDDPNIQFATGGRTLDFRIPAGSREAIFGDGAKAMPFQAGTVAGTISLSAALQVNTVNVTPSPVPSKLVAVASAPPVLRNVTVGARNASSIELLITGLSVTRSVTQLGLQFTGTPGAKLDTDALAVNVDAAFSAWYQNASSRTFGSQFTVSLTINFTGDVNALQSVSVTAVNSRGTSGAASVNIR